MNLQGITDLIQVSCARCGTIFCMSKYMNEGLRDSKKEFYCPSGHSNVYNETTQMKLDKALKENQSIKELKDAMSRNADFWRAKHDKLEKKLKRVKAKV